MKTRLFWGSSYDRGLEHILKMWPSILEKFPEATLEVCYGWDLFDRAFHNNPERQAWKQKIEDLMNQKGITHHGRLSKIELKNVRSNCDIWAYPTHFDEINCITGLDCQLQGLVPVVMDKAALKETVQSGIKLDGDIYDRDTREEYLKALLELMGDDSRWEQESAKGKKFATKFLWSEIAKKWSAYL